MRYLITQSLLSAWAYMYNCAEESSEAAREDFLAALHRETQEPSIEMLRGISFEDAVNAYLHGDVNAPKAHALEYAKRGHEEDEEASVKTVAGIVDGGTYQLTAYKNKRIAGIDFLLMAKCDWVKTGVIYDCKRVTNYEPGKYFGSAQHPMYLEVVDTAKRFVYVVCDGESVYTSDSYSLRDIPQRIEEIITQFVNDLKSMNLLEDYFKHWASKY